MTAIRKTSCGTYEVYGYRLQADGNKQRFSKTFKTRAEAKRFAAELDISAEERSSSITLAALIDEYINEVTAKKRSRRTEEIRLRRLQRDKLAAKTLSTFTKRTIENYIERRLNERALHRDTNILPSTVNRELTILSDVFQYAIKNELTDVNPCRGVEKLGSLSTVSGLLQTRIYRNSSKLAAGTATPCLKIKCSWPWLLSFSVVKRECAPGNF